MTCYSIGKSVNFLALIGWIFPTKFVFPAEIAIQKALSAARQARQWKHFTLTFERSSGFARLLRRVPYTCKFGTFTWFQNNLTRTSILDNSHINNNFIQSMQQCMHHNHHNTNTRPRPALDLLLYCHYFYYYCTTHLLTYLLTCHWVTQRLITLTNQWNISLN